MVPKMAVCEHTLIQDLVFQVLVYIMFVLSILSFVLLYANIQFLIALMNFNLGTVPWLGNILYAMIQDDKWVLVTTAWHVLRLQINSLQIWSSCKYTE